MTPLYGRSFQGERVYDERPTNPGQRVNTVAVLSKEGIKAQYSYMGSLNAKLFIPYLEKFVLPCMCDGQTLIIDFIGNLTQDVDLQQTQGGFQ